MDKYTEARASAVSLLKRRPHKSRFYEPLDFILDEHMRQRALCSLLEEISKDGIAPKKLAEVAVDFLKSDFALHVLDEEEDLFPLLRRRVDDEGRLDDVLTQLSADHAHDRQIAYDVLRVLIDDVDVELSAEICDLFAAFAVAERKHLIVENAIVVPLARASLSADDLQILGQRMAARRGVNLPRERHAE